MAEQLQCPSPSLDPLHHVGNLRGEIDWNIDRIRPCISWVWLILSRSEILLFTINSQTVFWTGPDRSWTGNLKDLFSLSYLYGLSDKRNVSAISIGSSDLPQAIKHETSFLRLKVSTQLARRFYVLRRLPSPFPWSHVDPTHREVSHTLLLLICWGWTSETISIENLWEGGLFPGKHVLLSDWHFLNLPSFPVSVCTLS